MRVDCETASFFLECALPECNELFAVPVKRGRGRPRKFCSKKCQLTASDRAYQARVKRANERRRRERLYRRWEITCKGLGLRQELKDAIVASARRKRRSPAAEVTEALEWFYLSLGA